MVFRLSGLENTFKLASASGCVIDLAAIDIH